MTFVPNKSYSGPVKPKLAAFEEVPFYPIGQYRQATAYRKTITGIAGSTATFWNVRPA